MKVLVDMNLSPGWVSFLAEAGFEAVHWSDVGAGNAPDSEAAAIRQAQQELLDGALISVDVARARLRILPLRE